MTIENCSTNPYSATVVGAGGSTNVFIIPPGARVSVPGVITSSGSYFAESSLCRGYLMVGDGVSGQFDIFLWQWPFMCYFVAGFSFAVVFMGIRAVIGMARAGFSGRDKLEVE